MEQTCFELHWAGLPADDVPTLMSAPIAPVPADPAPLVLADLDRTLWVTVDPDAGQLQESNPENALAGFRMVRRRLGPALAMAARTEGILVNGLPALPLTVLGARDAVALAPGCLCYVTERFRPFVGAPSGELLGKKCPFCRLMPDAKTRVVACMCGALYHWETADSHPDTEDKDRLRCFEKVKNCLSCGRLLTRDEFLIWDPKTL